MKVQLILPKCENPGARLIRGWPQPLGILSIATYLREYSPEIDVEILDGSVLSQEEIENRINADFVGITAITRSYTNVLRTAKQAHQVGAKIVLGGQHASALAPEILTNRPYIDAIIRYDGEIAFTQYINQVPLHKINNLVYRKIDGSICENPIQLVNINDSPFPDRSLLYLPAYDSNYIKNVGGPFRRGGTFCSHRGCRWRSQSHGGCVFCAIPDISWRKKHPIDIWREVEYLENLGFEFLYDVSDDIVADLAWLKELDRLKPRTKVHFLHYLGAKHTTEESIEALLNIGTVQVFTGFESLDPTCLDNMHKEASSKENIQAVQVLLQFGMRLFASFVAGVPSENLESIKRTMEFAKYLSELPITDGVHWDILKPIPGSRAFDMLLKHPEIGIKYKGKDSFNMESMRVDWVNTFCEVDYDELCQVEEEAKTLVPDSATFAPLDK